MTRVPGLPDDTFDHDGLLTKREIRAVVLAYLAPQPGELLWDVGAGAGSVSVEWMRSSRTCRAVAVEQDAVRAGRIRTNAARLGVPDLVVVPHRAPGALDGLPAPDAVFLGGGLAGDGMLAACWDALRPGGRLVATAVTVEGESVLGAAHGRLGGVLTRVAVAHALPIGGFTGWRPRREVTLWWGPR
ncbi:hypothetical protein Acsp06_65270 [Actinomycetospora sp. NBRC 106375]|uniref:precorrin-6Y C5,15-methyltransferase (decarboxylating) subunit CbiT n=1 Tax=Actinomycetospora sp. NBRC 106375 TaxID=3032207 RepID=UPI0024A512E6|nr:hypothetical protein Acsp06_65270 [Actinomycetospora sp. NBRC 106375]